MQLRSETEALFRDLVNYCRNDKDVVPTGVREDRAPTYRRLVRNIIFSNLEKAYPIANVTLGEEKWNRLTGDFFEQWNIPSPELWRMPYSLLEYVDSTNYAELIAAPYLTDLLLFEWKEIEIYMIEDYQYPELSQIADPLIDELQLNMESEIIEVGYPVHRERGPEFSEVNNRYLLLCYRHPETLSVKFIELAQGAALLVELREFLGGDSREVDTYC